MLWKNFLFAAAEASFENAIIVTFGVIGIAVLGWRVDIVVLMRSIRHGVDVVYLVLLKFLKMTFSKIQSHLGSFGERRDQEPPAPQQLKQR